MVREWVRGALAGLCEGGSVAMEREKSVLKQGAVQHLYARLAGTLPHCCTVNRLCCVYKGASHGIVDLDSVACSAWGALYAKSAHVAPMHAVPFQCAGCSSHHWLLGFNFMGCLSRLPLKPR